MENKKRMKQFARLTADYYFMSGYVKALTETNAEKHKHEIIARINLQIQIIEQQLKKLEKEITNDLTTLKNTFIYASAN